MKLLLTSQGITTNSIGDALTKLVDKSPYDVKVAVIPTARNAGPPRRGGFIGQFIGLWKSGYSWIDIVDPSAADIAWRERLEQADVIFVSGGNTFHLLKQARETGLDEWLKNKLGERVYVGVSAGSILATPTIKVATLPPVDHNLVGLTDLAGLGLVDFEIEPHCSQARLQVVKKYAETISNPIYALDDLSAVMVDGDETSVISDGFWELYT